MVFQIKRLNPFLEEKIFCISFQRNGTTSVAEFFRKNNFKVVDWSFNRYDWTNAYFNGDYEKIFNSKKFNEFTVFEDHPWFYQDFYKVLYHRFPYSKFVLFTRNADKWFDSLAYLFNVIHDVDATIQHYKVYGLEDLYYDLLKNKTPENRLRLTIPEKLRKRYINAYNFRNKQVVEFFKEHDNSRLIHLKLEDDDKWIKLGEYFNIKNIKGLEVHANKSIGLTHSAMGKDRE